MIPYLFLLLLSNILFIHVHAYFTTPITITDPRIKLEPKLAQASTFSYNGSIYAYGGLYNLYTYNVSHLFYKYDFDNVKHAFELSLLNTVNAGPRCTECNPVFIPRQNKLLILSNDKQKHEEGLEAVQYFQPYVFDFDTLTWSDLSSTAVYHGGYRGKEAFEMREFHSTVLANDGMVYIIGGILQRNNEDEDGPCPRSVIYYNITENSFHVLETDAPLCFFASNSFVREEASDEIYIVFGLIDSNYTSVVEQNNNTYGTFSTTYSSAYMNTARLNILHPSTGVWDYRSLAGPKIDPVYGATTQYDPNTKLLHVFGGVFIDSDEALHIDDSISSLNMAVGNGTWLTEYTYYNSERTEVATRFLASSVLHQNKYFMVFFGQNMEFLSMITTGEIDVFELPEFDTTQPVTEYIMTLLNQDPDANVKHESLNMHKKSVQYALVITAIIGIIVIYILVLFVFKFFRLIDSVKEILVSFLYQRRIGEPRSTEVFRGIVKIICFLIFCLYLVFAFDNVVYSTISTNSEFNTLQNQSFPDVRFCFTYWNFTSDISSNSIISCTIKGESYTELSDCSGSIKYLDSSIHAPILDETTYIQCFMFVSTPELVSNSSRPSLIFSIDTESYQVSSDSTVYVHVYDPKINPNRYLFLEGESLPSGYTQSDLNYWAEMGDNTVENILGYSFMGMNDTMVVTFDTTTYKNVDPKGAWNYIGGILPSYITTNNLTTEYNQKAVSSEGGFIQLTPLSFDRETITEKRDNTIISALGTIGGIMGLLASLRLFLFGSRPASPWGFVHTAFKPTHDRLLSDTLDHGLLNTQGECVDNSDVTYIPFVEPVDERFSHTFNKIHHQYHKKHEQQEVSMMMKSMEERLLRVEARNQMMELVLKSYYVDDQIFQSLKDTRDKFNTSNHTTLLDQHNRGSASSSPTGGFYDEKEPAIAESVTTKPCTHESKGPY